MEVECVERRKINAGLHPAFGCLRIVLESRYAEPSVGEWRSDDPWKQRFERLKTTHYVRYMGRDETLWRPFMRWRPPLSKRSSNEFGLTRWWLRAGRNTTPQGPCLGSPVGPNQIPLRVTVLTGPQWGVSVSRWKGLICCAHCNVLSALANPPHPALDAAGALV